MKMKLLIVAAFLAACFSAAPSRAALTQLSSLTNPTVQTLISMGSNPVVVGNMEFTNFSFTDNSTGTQLTPAQVQVQPYTASGNGLEFIAAWFASGGATLDDVISYDAISLVPTHPIGQLTLLTNATAPVSATGTFTTSTLLSQLIGGSSAGPVLSTYNNGVTPPVGQTNPNVNFAYTVINPQDELSETTTLLGSSGGGGVVTASVLENSYITVPETSHSSWVVPPLILLLVLMSRPGRSPLP